MINVNLRQENRISNTLIIIYSLLILILLASSISYIIFSIVYLIEYYDDANDCKNSHLWEYVLTSLIISTSNFTVKSSDNNFIIYITLTIISIINIALSIWGGIELWEKCCTELRYKNLWYIGLASFILQNTIVLISIISSTVLYYISYNIQNDNNLLTEKIINNNEQKEEIEKINNIEKTDEIVINVQQEV